MSWSHLVTILSVIGFLVTAAGLVGISFKVGRNAQTVSNYRDNADSWEKKALSQSGEIADLQARLVANDAVIRRLQDRVGLLEEMVTGKAAINELAVTISTSFVNLQAHVDSRMEQLRDDIRGKHE